MPHGRFLSAAVAAFWSPTERVNPSGGNRPTHLIWHLRQQIGWHLRHRGHLRHRDLTFAEALSECIPYDAAGSTLRLTVDARITASTNSLDASLAAIAFYTSADCTEPYASAPQAGTFSPPGDWYPLVKIATVPAGTQSVRVRLQVSKSLALQPSVVVQFDRVFLGPNTYVFDEGLELGEICRWSAATP
jgi:hypothetical protein